MQEKCEFNDYLNITFILFNFRYGLNLTKVEPTFKV